MSMILDISEDDIKQAEAFSVMEPGTYLFTIDNTYMKRNKANTGDNVVFSLLGAESTSEGKRLLKHFPLKGSDGKPLTHFMKGIIIACGGKWERGASIDFEACKGKTIKVVVKNRLDDNDVVRNDAADFFPAD